jgi:hypothetical protein
MYVASSFLFLSFSLLFSFLFSPNSIHSSRSMRDADVQLERIRLVKSSPLLMLGIYRKILRRNL